MLLDGIVMKSCSNIQNDRSTAAIFHLLYGKRSIQTVQDAHMYDLKQFYGIYRPITKKILDDKMNQLIKQKFITDDYKPTSFGTQWLNDHDELLSFDRFNGIKYHTIAPIFSDRLLLFVQTLTNSKKQHLSFIPVIDKTPILYWMKNFYHKVKFREATYLNAVHEELHLLLDNFSDVEASIFVDRLSGYKTYGKSRHQLSLRYHINLPDVHLVWMRMIHHILTIIYSNYANYPVLYSVVSDIKNNIFITSSANKTYQLLYKNYSIEDIAQIRQLKINTIFDHIVEIALFDQSFPINLYVSNEHQEEIAEAIKQTNSTILKRIKETVSDEISYFQIRLVLATVNNSIQHRCVK